MVIIMNPGSFLSQLSNFCFLASGLFNDLLIIRLFLTFAYTFLLLSGLMGLPGWGEESLWTGRISVDIVCWSIANIVLVHGSGVLRMYYDERFLRFELEEHEMLWRFFYRHSGLSKAQFKAILLPHLELTTFEKGSTIPCKDHFYILLDGIVDCTVVHHESPQKKHNLLLGSGDMFPILHVYKNHMPLKSFFHRSELRAPTVRSDRSKAFSISTAQLEAMATHPHAEAAWKAVLVASLAEIAERQYSNRERWENDNSIDIEPSSLAEGTQQPCSATTTKEERPYHHPLFDPLLPSEEPDPLLAGSGGGLSRPLKHALKYMALSIYTPWPWGRWPIGLRHSLRPPDANRDDIDKGDTDPSVRSESC